MDPDPVAFELRQYPLQVVNPLRFDVDLDPLLAIHIDNMVKFTTEKHLMKGIQIFIHLHRLSEY